MVFVKKIRDLIDITSDNYILFVYNYYFYEKVHVRELNLNVLCISSSEKNVADC